MQWVILILSFNLMGLLAGILWIWLLILPEPCTVPYYNFPEMLICIYLSNTFSGAIGAWIGYLIGKRIKRKREKLSLFKAMLVGAVSFFLCYFLASSCIILNLD